MKYCHIMYLCCRIIKYIFLCKNICKGCIYIFVSRRSMYNSNCGELDFVNTLCAY